MATQDTLNSISRRVILAAGIGLILILLAATAVVLSVLRKEELERAGWHLQNLALALDGQIRESVRSVELTTMTMADELARRYDGTHRVSDRELFERLKARVGAMPHVLAMAFLDADGKMQLHSSRFSVPEVDILDREFFLDHRERRIKGLHVGKPVLGRTTGEWVITFSRRVEDGRGGFRGIVVAVVRVARFAEIFGALELGVGGRVFLFREDGVLLALHPAGDHALGDAFAEDPLFKQGLAGSASGVQRRAGLIDTRQRLIAFNRSKDYPLVVAVSSTENFILSEWRRDAWRIGTGAAGTIALVAAALFFLMRQLRVSAGLRHDLDGTGQRLRGIIQSVMDAVITVDERQTIVLFNSAAEKIFRCPAAEAIGSPLERFIPERFRAAHHGHIERFSKTGITTRMMGARLDLFGLRVGGEEFPIDASISQVTAEGHMFYTVILRDITERMAAAAALERSNRELQEAGERLRGIIQSAMDAIITVDEKQRVVMFNAAAEKTFGCLAAEAVGGPLDRFIPERFRTAHHRHIEHFGETGSTTRMMGANLVLYGLRGNGEEFPIDASISQITVDGRKLYTVILRDITRRREAEEALQRSHQELRELSNAMHEVREAERLRIARELHDELAQWLTAIKMDVSWLSARLPRDQAQLVDKTERMKGLVDTTVAAVRRIAADLRPVMLDDLGLVAALESLLHDLSQRTGIVVSFEADEAGLDFGEPLSSALYRIAQEALTNVARHAQATEVRVGIRIDGDRLVLTVRDNGRGFDPDAAAGRKSYGVQGIRERAYTLGGAARIESHPGGGTVVEIVIPVARYRRREASDGTGTAG